MLKLSPTGPPQDRANRLEAYALRRWAGNGAARLLAADTAEGALLLERCLPGATIDSLDDDEMVQQGCALARRLQRVPDREDLEVLPCALDEIADRTQRFDHVIEQMGQSLSSRVYRAAKDVHVDLTTGCGATVVCHGDMNPGNLLAHHGGWVVVDPLPILADPAYDAVSLVWSKRAWLLAQPNPDQILQRRLRLAADALAIDQQRLRAWTIVRLFGLLEERFAWGGYNEAPFLELAELLTAPSRQD